MNNPRTERLIFGGFLAILLVTAWMSASSDTSAQMRAPAPWIAWLALRGANPDSSNPPAFYLLLYRWDDRVLHAIQIPETRASLKAYAAALRRSPGEPSDGAVPVAGNALKTAGPNNFVTNNPSSLREDGVEHDSPAAERALIQFHDAELQNWISPQLSLRWKSNLANPGSLEEVKVWMLSWPRTFRFWLALPGVLETLRRSGNPKPSAYDVAVLAWEAFRLEPNSLRLHALPPERDRAIFFSLINNTALPGAQPKPTTVDILNASGEPGVALQATKVLRWRGLDVVNFGNAAAPSPSTRFIDRTALFSEAAAVARALGCDHPEIADEMDSGRRERVTVILGEDFRSCASLRRTVQTADGRSESWN